eukprot:gene11079-12912_t
MLVCSVAQFGTSVESGTAVTLDGTSTFTSINNIISTLSVRVFSSTDKVLLLVNVDVTASANSQSTKFTIFRDGTDLSPGKVMANVDPTLSGESQSASFTFMDAPPAAGTYLYTVRGALNGVVSSAGQVRQLAAIVIPSTVPTNRLTLSTSVTVSATTFTDISLGASVTPPSTSHRVLVCASFSMDPQAADSAATVALFRNGAQVGTESLQKIKMAATDDSRMFSMCYLDSPASAAGVAYSVRPAVYSSSYSSYIICDSGAEIAHLNLMTIPNSRSAVAQATTETDLTATSWTSLSLSTSVTPPATTSKVLITVTVNYRAESTTSKTAFTIFRGSTNLGHVDNGLQVVKMTDNNLNVGVAMTFLDSPGSTSSVTYSVQARSLQSGTTYRVSHDTQARQIALVVVDDLAAVPTIAPTLAPTIMVNDCTTGCTFTDDIAVASNYLYKRLTLPTAFTLKFSLTLPTLGSGNPNILDIRDAVTGYSLLAVHRATNTDTRWSYNGVVFISSGMPLISGSIGVTPNVATVYTVVLKAGSIDIESTYQVGVVTTTSITSIDTADRAYDLYLSNGVDATSGGAMSDIDIKSNTLSPTRTPSDAPSLHPSRSPSLHPSRSPSLNP